MAIIKTGSIDQSALGVISGPVFTHRQGTQGIRPRYKPQTPTRKQRTVRLAFAEVDSAWVHLSDPLKEAWRNYQSWRKNYGYNRFQKVNIPLVLTGAPMILDPANIP